MTRLPFFLCLFLLLSSPANAEVILNVVTQHYSLIGTTKQDIMRNMQRHSPYKQGSSFVPAYTGTEMKFSYTLEQRGSLCSVKDPKVFLNLTYMYPKLAQHQTSGIRWWWRDIIKAYTIHEEIHGDISIRWAHELDRVLRSIKDIACPSAQEVIKTKAEQVYTSMRNEQEAYDEVTRHGLQQHKYHGPEQQ